MTENIQEPADDDLAEVLDHSQLAEDLRQVETTRRTRAKSAITGAAGDDPHQVDALLLDRLIRTGLRGAEYDAFIIELTRYGLAVVTGWVLDGTAFARAAKLGRPVAAANRPTSRRSRRDDAVAIADLTVTHGLMLFEKMVLRQRRWRPERGASIKTFFIGGCLLKLSNACRMWRPDTPECEIPAGEAVPYVPGQRPHSDPQDLVILQAMIEEALGPETARVRRMLTLSAQGYTYREIAELLDDGISERAVEGEIYRARRRARLRVRGGDSDVDRPGVR